MSQSPEDNTPRRSESGGAGTPAPGGIVHAYLGYDPKNFPSPTAPPPDIAGAAFEHMLRFGSTRQLTPEELANAIRLDPSMFPMLGPSLGAIAESLRERKRRILEKYESDSVRTLAGRAVEQAARDARPPGNLRGKFASAVQNEQLHELEQIYYKVPDNSPFALELMHVLQSMGEKYQVEELASKYQFTGRESMDVPLALAIKEELEAIDKLLKQLEEAARNAKLALIEMDELQEFAQNADMEALRALQQQIEDYIRQEAEAQGLDQTRQGYALSPKAMKLFQGRLLQEIFASLEAARSGRHEGVLSDDGAVEIAKTKPYEFGDSVSSMDVPQSYVNAALRIASARRSASGSGGVGSHAPEDPPRFGLLPEDIEVHLTKKTPKCATSVVIDMSGSMRNDGQYINAKRMALALDGLIRTEYPGDFLSFVEVYSIAKVRHVSEVPGLMPKPVTIRAPKVRLRADLSDPKVSEEMLPPHFTNLQHGLLLARRMLAVQDTPNRQIMLITDGLPTAHMDGEHLYLLYPPDPLTEEATMREARACGRDGITINVFLLPNWWQTSEDVQFAHRLAEQTRGRVFFTGGRDLDRFVLWDYVKMRRSILS